MEFVCPKPENWNNTYQKLNKFYLKNKDIIKTQPPVPLILNGWIYSTDYQKKLRWEETLKWAKIHKCENLIPNFEESGKYFVKSIKPTFIQEENPYGS